ncbi:MAG: carboxypeptidase regulatory-like domain-containing protein, partial [Planctomycetes bacterium]|nr:carboxypeptidase regulatory-like domain-containing protein [Planctomycetota bacterium]
LPPAAAAPGGLAGVQLAWPLALAVGVALLATLWWFKRQDARSPEELSIAAADAFEPRAALDQDFAAPPGARSDVASATEPSAVVATAASAVLEAGSLELEVRWSDGSLAESVEVVVLHLDSPDVQRSARRGLTNARGRLLFPDCSGPLGLRPDRGEHQTLEVGAHEQRRYDIELARGRDIDVRVVDTTGTPIEGAAIGFSSLHHFMFGAAIARTDAQGLATLRDVPKDRRIVGWKPGFVCEEAVLAAGGAQEPGGRGVVELVLSPGAVELRGVVLGSDGRPAADADLRIGLQPAPREILECDGVALRTRTNRKGEYVFPAVPSGALELRVRGAHDAPWLETLALVPGETRVHDVRLVPGASVHGRLEAGELPASTGNDDDRDSVWIIAGIPGSFEVVELRARIGEPYAVHGLSAGKHRIRAAGPAGVALSPELELAVGQSLAQDLRLERAPVLAGRLLERGAGRPLSGWHVVAQLATGGRAGYAQCDAQGAFELKGIAEEQVDLHFFEPGVRAGQPERILRDVAVGRRDLLVELDTAASD